MNLMLTPRAWQKMKWESVAPYNDRDLVLFLSPNLSIILRKIRSISDNLPLNIRQLMEHENYRDIFCCNDFEKRLSTFAENMDTKLERLFTTKKSSYLFFDKEEQDCLKSIISDVSLTCSAEIQRRRKSDDTFVHCPLQTMLEIDYMNIANKLKHAGIVCEISLDEYMRYTKKFHTFKRRDGDKNVVSEIFSDFPELKQESKAETKTAYKKYASELHPDKNPDNPDAQENFTKLQNAWEKLQETRYYQQLKDKKEEGE